MFKTRTGTDLNNSGLTYSPSRYLLLLVAFFLAPSTAMADLSGVRKIVITSSPDSGSNVLQIAEVSAIDTGGTNDLATTANGATVSASSVYRVTATGAYAAANAIDGSKLAGRNTLANYFHSGVQAGQSLTVTLASDATLSEIQIIGRADCCSERDVYDIELLDSSNQVLASYTGVNGNNSSHLARQILAGNGPDNGPGNGAGSTTPVHEILIRNSTNSGSNYLQVAEVVALSLSTLEDVALSSKAASVTSSSNYNNQLIASNSIDGDVSPGDGFNYFHSKGATDEWLRVTLANPTALAEVTLIGRSNCCSSRDVYDVQLLDDSGNIITEKNNLNANNTEHRVTWTLAEQTSNHFTVTFVDANEAVTSISQARSILDNPGSRPVVVQQLPTLNLNGGGATGNFSNDTAFPHTDTFAVRASRQIFVTEAGSYTFGVNSDDGVVLSIDGVQLIIDDSLHAQRNRLASTTLSEGAHDVEVVFFENGGGANLELFARAGTQAVFDDQFNLLGRSLGGGTAAPASNIVGRWGDVMDWPLVAVSMANLPDGRILTYSGSERRTWPTTEQTYSATWDPLTGQFDETLHLGHNMFCAAMSMTEDGEVFVNGGRNSGNSRWTSLFNHEADSWTQIENMASGGRWYPTTLALGDGNIFTAMGNSTNVRNPDLWTPGSGWRVLNGIDFLSMRTRRNEIRRENVFPLLSQAPDGDIYHFWDTVENHYLSTAGSGQSRAANPDTDHGEHAGGIQVMYDEGKLLITGNNDGSWGGNSSVITNKAFTVDLNPGAPVMRDSSPMNFPRKFHQMIPLPTGEVLVVGGNTTGSKFQDNGSVLDAEIWNPETRQFRVVAPMTIPRDYHSTAVLMIDGRIITAGGGYHPNDPSSGGTHQDAQIFSPPYLFAENASTASRPVITANTDRVTHGQTITVNGSDDLAYFSLIKMSATTHAINTDARFFKPGFSKAGVGQYRVNMHGNPNVATPGYWMLFGVNTNGVPSIAEIIQVTLDAPPPPEPSIGEITAVPSAPTQIGMGATFNVNVAGSNLQYSWNFGDGSGDSAFSSGSSVSHSFISPGRYVVSVTVRDEFGETASETFNHLVHRPLTATVPMQSSGLLELADKSQLWVVNPDNDSVSVIDTVNLIRSNEITVGENPRSLARAANGDVWVVNKTSATVSVIDANTLTLRQTINLDPGSQPHGIVFGNGTAYIALESIGTVVQLSNAGSELRRQFAGDTPRHLALNSDRNELYVSSFITPALPGESGRTVQVNNAGAEIRRFNTNAASLTASSVIRLSHSNREVSEHSGPGIPNYIGAMSISPDGVNAWVPSKQDNILAGALRGGDGMTFDQSVRAISSVIDIGSGLESLSRRVDHDNASVASAAVHDPLGLTLFVSLEGNRQIALVDVNTAIEIARFDTAMAPQSLVVSADGKRLYVHNFMSRSIGAHDISGVINAGATDVATLATIATVATERLAANVLRGKQLFYDARDDRLAALDYMSCAACHNEAGHDGRVWDFTGLGEGLRNTISLNGTGGMANGLLHWSSNFDELQDFEGQIRDFAGGRGLMSDTAFLSGDRQNPLGDSKAGLSADLDALAAYLDSLDTPPLNPFRSSNTNSVLAATGKSLFETKGCAVCHSGSRFTETGLTPVLHDVGTLDQDSGNRLSGALSGLSSPTLIGSWQTAPYLHDGSANTLQEAIEAHSTISFNAGEAAALTEFVMQLDGTDAQQASITVGGISNTNAGHIDGWRSNLVIDEGNAYINQSGAPQVLDIAEFRFYARRVADPVTPFVVRRNADNNFTVLAIGTTRSNYSVGENRVSFSAASSRSITLGAGETLLVGFLDARADGSGHVSASVIPFDSGSNEIWYSGGSQGNQSASITEGNAPQRGTNLLTNLKRRYRFNILLQPR